MAHTETNPAPLSISAPFTDAERAAFIKVVATDDVEAMRAALCAHPDLAKAALAEDGTTAFALAVQNGSGDCLPDLLRLSDPLVVEDGGISAFRVAATLDDRKVLKALLAHQPTREGLQAKLQLRPRPQDLDYTPLMMAASRGNVECVKELLPYIGASHTDSGGETALMLAAHFGCPDCVTALLPHCDARAANKKGRTALFSVLNHHGSAASLDCLRLLWPHSDETARDDSGKTALEHAVGNRWYQMADWMVAASARSRENAQWVIETVPEHARGALPQSMAIFEKHALVDAIGADRAGAGRQPPQTVKHRGAGCGAGRNANPDSCSNSKSNLNLNALPEASRVQKKGSRL